VAARHPERHSDDDRRGSDDSPGRKNKNDPEWSDHPGVLNVLANQLDRPVMDMTGLSGRYDITLDFAIDPSIMQAKMAAMGGGPPPGTDSPDGAAQDPSGGATIFSALKEQLGVRLEARKGPVDL